MVELVVTAVLETVAARCEGSSPSLGTNAPVAQLDEHFATNEKVRSSNLFESTIKCQVDRVGLGAGLQNQLHRFESYT